MATLNHAKTTAWESASETIRNKRPPGADISFSISRASTFSFSLVLPNPPPPALSRSLESLDFSQSYFPSAHLSLLNDPRNRNRGRSLPLLLAPSLFSSTRTLAGCFDSRVSRMQKAFLSFSIAASRSRSQETTEDYLARPARNSEPLYAGEFRVDP